MARFLPFDPDTPKRVSAHVLAPLTVTLLLASCGEHARLPESAGIGPNPQLPPPHETTIPTFKIAAAAGWLPGGHPIPAAGLAVNAFAQGLAHPRRPYVLPNGDVLVAETDSPPKPDDEKGLRGFVQKMIKKTVGSDTPSANRISLLRDTDGDGIAEVRTVFVSGLNSPFGMVLVGNDFYVADTDAVLRFHYKTGDTKIDGAGEKVADLPAGTINHHWTKDLTATQDGSKLYATVGSNSNAGENGMAAEDGRAAVWEIDPKTGAHRISPPACAIPMAPAGRPIPARCGWR